LFLKDGYEPKSVHDYDSALLQCISLLTTLGEYRVSSNHKGAYQDQLETMPKWCRPLVESGSSPFASLLTCFMEGTKDSKTGKMLDAGQLSRAIARCLNDVLPFL